MSNESTRNTILFIVCTVAILLLYQVFVLQPATDRERIDPQTPAEAANAANTAFRPETAVFTDRRTALATGPRVPISTPTLSGSLSLQGARIDDLFLTDYRETLDGDEPVELFRPQGTEHAYFAQFGWLGQNVPGVPGPNTEWTLTEGSTLAPGAPVTLTYDNGQGLRFTRRIEVDEQYVFTLTDTVANLG